MHTKDDSPQQPPKESKVKKRKLEFIIPEQIPIAEQSGWVYRSDVAKKPQVQSERKAQTRPAHLPIPTVQSVDFMRLLWMPFELFSTIILALLPGSRPVNR
jgi:hypothetical protein